MLAAAPAFADETDPPGEITVTGNVALVTDYRFRGLSRSGGDPAVQGGVTVDHASGFYLGVWGSSTDFGAAAPVYGSLELDLSGGWRGPIGGGGVVADVGLLYYAFPDGKVGKANIFEPYASLSATLGPITGKVGANYAWKQQSLNFDGGGKDDNLYLYADLDAGVPNTPVSVSAHLGYTDGALSPKYATGATAGYDGGFDWSLGASYTVLRNLSVSARYVGVEGRSIDDFSNDTVVATLKLSF